MDRYVVVVIFNLESDGSSKDYNGLQTAKNIYDKLKEISASKFMTDVSPMPACSLSGKPLPQKWFFSLQACCGSTQFCSSEWEELVESSQRSDSEEVGSSALEACLAAVEEQEEQTEQPSIKELLEEAADGLHLLADKLPPPGRCLIDVILLCVDKEAPTMKDLLPLIGSLKHMRAWHSAKMTMVTEHRDGWQREASYLMARVCDSGDVLSCLDERDVWRGAVLIREKKMASEVRFDGFCLKRVQPGGSWSSVLSEGSTHSHTDHQIPAEVFHYYQPTLNLVQLVLLSDLPALLHSSTEFELNLTSRSKRARMLLDQLATLRGKVAALFSLSCVVSAVAMPSASQLSTQRWKEFMAKRPKALTVPEVEVKGETARYFLLVQGTADGGCRAQMIHSANQINGAAALDTVNALMRRNDSSSSAGQSTVDWLRSLPSIRGDELLRQEKCLAKVQTLVLKECLSRKEEAQRPAGMAASHLRALLSLAREQFISVQQSALPKGPGSTQAQEHSAKDADRHCSPASAWPERSVLHNYEKLRTRSRQKSRSSLLASSSESLMGPKDGQRDGSSLLDATELLKHFTLEGQPRAPLQPLLLQRGENAFQLSPDLTPRKVSQLSFRKATRSHYHGIEFCLDELGALERDRGMVRLQSRLIRYETHTTCSKEPCPIPFALSPAPSPAVLSEPGSVPDGESLAQAELPRLKRHARDPDLLTYPHKRLAKSESGECPGSHSSSSSGFVPLRALRALRQQTRPQSTSGAPRSSARGGARTQEALNPPPPQQSQRPEQGHSESRSQKHHRMLKEVVMKTLKQHGISSQHQAFEACSQRLFEISKFYLKDLKTSRGLHEEMKKAASSNAKQVIDWVLEKASKT
ncbi:mdm2-binding protein isoform X1 [Alosa sapidissima]|uniref:mdm2-binding protein isoform X1 n=2 Tax=Alosa sapidissima TaxID=34773 RepID=UPI001C09FA76|nr:mdm2-binding protein isoform X1 [Alosa sapidissima]